jgi:hypothetical protein
LPVSHDAGDSKLLRNIGNILPDVTSHMTEIFIFTFTTLRTSELTIIPYLRLMLGQLLQCPQTA